MPKRQVRYDNPVWDGLVETLGHDPRPYEPGAIALPFTIDATPFTDPEDFILPERHAGELIEETS